MDQFCLRFLDATNRPFDYHDDGRVPDGYPQNTTKLVDFYDATPFSLPPTSGGSESIIAIGFYMTVGINQITNTLGLYNASTGLSSATSPLYSYCFFGIKADGSIVSQTLTAAPAKVNVVKELAFDEKSEDTKLEATSDQFWSNGLVNYETILGTASDTSYDTDGLVANFRVLSAGMRLWPVYEIITNSSNVTYPVKYYGCQMTPVQLQRLAAAGTNIYTVMKECPEFFETHNSTGISGRLQLFQEGPLKLYEINSLMNWNNSAFSTGNMFFPTLVCQLNEAVTWDAVEGALPFNFMYRITLEAVLQTPTPIVSSRPPLSPCWKHALNTMAYSTDKYPTITEGHSFKRVIMASARFLVNNNPTLQPYLRAYDGIKKLMRLESKYAKKKTFKPSQVARQVQAITGTGFNPSNASLMLNSVRNLNRRAAQYQRKRRPKKKGNTNFSGNRNKNANNNRLTQENQMAKKTDIRIFRGGGRRGRGRF